MLRFFCSHGGIELDVWIERDRRQECIARSPSVSLSASHDAHIHPSLCEYRGTASILAGFENASEHRLGALGFLPRIQR
jgi:hypothetical protein